MSIRLKKIIIMLLLFVTIISFFTNSFAGITEEQRQAIIMFSRGIIGMDETEQKLRTDLVYSPAYRLDNTWKLSNSVLGLPLDDGKIHFTCTTYVAYIYRSVLGIGGKYGIEDGPLVWPPSTFLSQLLNNTNSKFYIPEGGALPGDILVDTGHIMIYVGKINGVDHVVHAWKYHGIPENYKDVSITPWNVDGTTVGRIREDEDIVNFNPTGPNGQKLDLTSAFELSVSDNPMTKEEAMKALIAFKIDSQDFYYRGIPNLLEEREFNFIDSFIETVKWVFNNLTKIIDWVIGFVTLGIRVVMIGWTYMIEQSLNSLIEIASKTSLPDGGLTMDNIVFNKISILDPNVFNLENDVEGSFTYIMKDAVAKWYVIFRDIAVVLMLLVLIYLGIRLALASLSAERKDAGKYKTLLLDWITAFAMIFIMHFVIYIIFEASETMIRFISSNIIGSGKDLYSQVRDLAYSIEFTKGFTYTILYMMLVFYSFKFLLVYLKRVLSVLILIVMAPFTVIGYAFDKISSGKNKVFSVWLKELVANILIQPIHCLIYVVFVSLALNIDGMVGMILAFVFMNFMLKAEDIVKGIFQISGGKGYSLKSVEDNYTATSNAALAVTAIGGSYLGGVLKRTTTPIRAAYKGVEKYRNLKIQDTYERNIHNGDIIKAETDLEKSKYDGSIFSENSKLIQKTAKEGYGVIKDTVVGLGTTLYAIPNMVLNPQKGFSMLYNGLDKLYGGNTNIVGYKKQSGKKVYKHTNKLERKATSKNTTVRQKISRGVSGSVKSISRGAFDVATVGMTKKAIHTKDNISNLQTKVLENNKQKMLLATMELENDKLTTGVRELYANGSLKNDKLEGVINKINVMKDVKKALKLVEKEDINDHLVDYIVKNKLEKVTVNDLSEILESYKLKTSTDLRVNLDRAVEESIYNDVAINKYKKDGSKVDKEKKEQIITGFNTMKKDENKANKILTKAVDEDLKNDFVSKLEIDELTDLLSKTLLKRGSLELDFEKDFKHAKSTEFIETILTQQSINDEAGTKIIDINKMVEKMIENNGI